MKKKPLKRISTEAAKKKTHKQIERNFDTYQFATSNDY